MSLYVLELNKFFVTEFLDWILIGQTGKTLKFRHLANKFEILHAIYDKQHQFTHPPTETNV